jgi:hypothetical protein
MPSSFNTSSGFSNFTTPASNQTVNGTTYLQQRTDISKSSNCTNLNTLSGSSKTLVARTDVAGTSSNVLTNTTTPVHADSVQTMTYTETEPHAMTGYRYTWKKNGAKSNSCWLEMGTGSYSKTRTATSTKDLTWTSYENVTGWTYQNTALTVSGLKGTGSNWNGSVSLPLTTTSGGTVYPSGSTSPTSITISSNVDVAWGGCIEERQTYQNSNGSPQNDWATIPSTAYDMNIDMVPSDLVANSKWGPMLADATWGPYSAKNCSYFGCSYTKTAAPYSSTSDLDHNNNYSCPTASRKLTIYNTATDLETYIDSFTATGATYHDIGMLWGARLMSPTGIFASENAYTPAGRSIQRHLIFMTDGDTNTSGVDYSAYGMGYWSRRQTSYAPSDTQMDNMTNARLVALCTAIKNMNITLWVVSFGGSVNNTTETRLSNCATSGHYYSASNNAALISRFRQIASEISELRLTS